MVPPGRRCVRTGSPSSSPLTPCRLRTSRPAPPIPIQFRTRSVYRVVAHHHLLRPRRPVIRPPPEPAGHEPGELDFHALNAMLNLYDADGKIQFEKDREAANQYFLQHVSQNGVLPRPRRAGLPGRGELLRAPRVLRRYNREFIPRAVRLRVQAEVPLPDVPRRVQYYTSYAEDLRREALPGALRGPCLHGGADAGRRRRVLARQLVDEIISGGSNRPPIPELGEEAARRAGQLLPPAHRGRHGSIGRSINSALQLSKRGGIRYPAAEQHPRARCPDQRSRTRAAGSSRS